MQQMANAAMCLVQICWATVYPYSRTYGESRPSMEPTHGTAPPPPSSPKAPHLVAPHHAPPHAHHRQVAKEGVRGGEAAAVAVLVLRYNYDSSRGSTT